ncbi:hypothetical protein, partial [Cohnella terricola]|uniref:hypothetical protein n=1 Tax=Cohnella terricola TaxID=1289167 RepID=UPI001C9858D6
DGERIPPINMSRHFKLNLLNDVRIMGFRGSFFMSTFSMQGQMFFIVLAPHQLPTRQKYDVFHH